jgi:hypothetical protein
MEFWVASCAEIYQLTLGGVIYAVDISGSIDSATDPVTSHFGNPRAHYWPRSLPNPELFADTTVTDWWILFSYEGLADIWIMRWPEHTRVCRTLFD